MVQRDRIGTRLRNAVKRVDETGERRQKKGRLLGQVISAADTMGYLGVCGGGL